MKYIEYIYLGAAFVLVVLLAQGFADFTQTQKILVCAAIGVTAFMFSFRRRQRLAFERSEKQRIQKLEEEAESEVKENADA